MSSRALLALLVALVALTSSGSAAAHACAYSAEDACVRPPATRGGASIAIDVRGIAARGTTICIMLDDRRALAALSSRAAPQMPRSTCPSPVRLVPSRSYRVCVADYSRDGKQACFTRRSDASQYRLALFRVSAADESRGVGRSFARTVRVRVPNVRRGMHVVSWFDCPPGDCTHLVFTGFRILR